MCTRRCAETLSSVHLVQGHSFLASAAPRELPSHEDDDVNARGSTARSCLATSSAWLAKAHGYGEAMLGCIACRAVQKEDK